MGRRKRKQLLTRSTGNIINKQNAGLSDNSNNETKTEPMEISSNSDSGSSDIIYSTRIGPSGSTIISRKTGSPNTNNETNVKPPEIKQITPEPADSNKPLPPSSKNFPAWIAMGNKNKFINVNIKMLDILQQMGEAINNFLEDPNLTQDRTAPASRLLQDLQNKVDTVKICVQYNSVMAIGRLDLLKN